LKHYMNQNPSAILQSAEVVVVLQREEKIFALRNPRAITAKSDSEVVFTTPITTEDAGHVFILAEQIAKVVLDIVKPGFQPTNFWREGLTRKVLRAVTECNNCYPWNDSDGQDSMLYILNLGELEELSNIQASVLESHFRAITSSNPFSTVIKVALTEKASEIENGAPFYGIVVSETEAQDIFYPAAYVSMMRRPGTIWKVYYAPQGELPSTQDLPRLKGLMFSGSTSAAYDESKKSWQDPLKQMIREAHHLKVKMIGICFGHQVIAAALGGEVKRRDGPMIIGTETIELTKDFTKSFETRGRKSLTICQYHGDEVVKLPEGAILSAFSPSAKVESYMIGKSVLTFQGHPEFGTPFMMLDYCIEEGKTLEDEDTIKYGKQFDGSSRDIFYPLLTDFLIGSI
jgi:GMP synthase-like glutamine amidotransferase